MNSYYVYILTTKNNKMLYIGVTNNLERRIWEHRQKLASGYTYKYNLNKLVWFEEFGDIRDAIAAEKKLKGWLRVKKDNLISALNPSWIELYPSAKSQDDKIVPQDNKKGTPNDKIESLDGMFRSE